MDLPDIGTGQGIWSLIAIAILGFTLSAIAVQVRIAIRPSTAWENGVDTDELADHIEESVKASTVDLLNAFASLEADTTRIANTLDRIDERHAEQFKPVRMEKFDV